MLTYIVPNPQLPRLLSKDTLHTFTTIQSWLFWEKVLQKVHLYSSSHWPGSKVYVFYFLLPLTAILSYFPKLKSLPSAHQTIPLQYYFVVMY